MRVAKTPERRAKLEAELYGPPLPEEIAYVWTWFHELIAGATPTATGVLRITWRDIEAWSGLTGVIVRPNEATLLLRLGDALVRSGEFQSE